MTKNTEDYRSVSGDAWQAATSGLARIGVERVVLLDSYIRGSRTELLIDGHIGITGPNGVGKTSMIRLLPLFFGAIPSSLAKRLPNSQLKRFEDYYLPSDGSYIVFEYRTSDGLQLAVFTATASRQLRPVLISGEYDDNLFIDENGNFRPADGLHAAARAAGRIHQTQSTLKSYRNVVLGSPRRHARKANEYCFNVLTGRDANRQTLINIHRILSATLNNEVDERLLRQLLLELALNETDTNSDELSHIAIRDDDVASWLGNYQGIEKLRSSAGVACQAIRRARELSDLGYRETTLVRASEHRHRVQKQQQADLKATLTQVTTRQAALNKEYESREQAFRDDKSRLGHEIEDLRNEIASLANRYNSFRDRDIDTILATANLLASRREAAGQREQELSALTSQSRHIDSEIDLQITSARSARDGEHALIAEQRSEHDQTARQQRDALDQRHASESGELAAQQHAKIESLTTEKANAAAEQKRLDDLIVNAQPDPAIRKALDDQRNAKDVIDEELNAARQAHRKAEDHLRKKRGEQEQVDSRLRRLKAERTSKTEEHQDLEIELRRDGTLLQYVREHVEDWPDTLSAVLHKGRSLLYEENLAPRPAHDPKTALFGIEIDTSGLKAEDVDETDRTRLESLNNALGALDAQIKDVDARLAKCARAVASAQTTEREAGVQVRRKSNQAGDAKNALKDAERAVSQSVEAGRERHVEQRREAAKRLNGAASELTATFAAHKDDREQLARRHRTEKTDLSCEHDGAITGLQQRTTQANDALQQAIENLESIRAQRRREGGVDTQAIDAATDAWKEALTQRKKAEEANQVAGDYKAFRQHYDARWPVVQADRSTLNGKLSTLNSEWEQAKRGYTSQFESMRSEGSAIKDSIERNERECSALGDLAAHEIQLGTSADITDNEIESLAARKGQSLLGDLDELKRDMRSQTKELRQKVGEVCRLFVHSASPMCREFAESHGLTDHFDASPKTLMAFDRPLLLFFGEPEEWAHTRACFPAKSWGEHVEDSVRGVANHSFALNAFIKPLQRVRNAVNRQAREIQRHFRSFLAHLDSIEWIEIDCRMDLNMIDGYQGAVRAESAIERYLHRRDETGDTRALPGAEVRDAFEKLQKHLVAQSREQKINIFSAVQMEFRIQENETKGVKHCRHNDSLREQFSQGIGTIVALVVLMGFLEALRGGVPLTTPWMLDELLTLDETNSRGLLAAMTEQNIFLITTSPDIKAELDPYFARRYALQTINEGGKALASPMFVEIDAAQERRDPFATALEASDRGDHKSNQGTQ